MTRFKGFPPRPRAGSHLEEITTRGHPSHINLLQFLQLKPGREDLKAERTWGHPRRLRIMKVTRWWVHPQPIHLLPEPATRPQEDDKNQPLRKAHHLSRGTDKTHCRAELGGGMNKTKRRNKICLHPGLHPRRRGEARPERTNPAEAEVTATAEAQLATGATEGAQLEAVAQATTAMREAQSQLESVAAPRPCAST